MEVTPEWLPAKLILNGSSIDDDYAKLYAVFEHDFVLREPAIVDGCRVVVNNRVDPSFDNKCYTFGFTHLVTHGTGDRYIDYDRAKRLPWVRAIIDNYQEPEVAVFYVDQVKGETLYLWLSDSDFVVILRRLNSRLERMNPTKIIVTGYYVNPSGRHKLQRLHGRSTRQL